MVRGKFQCVEVTQLAYSESARRLKFSAVCDDGTPENQRYHKYTPTGSLEIVIDNPSALEQFQLGKSYYLDFTPAD